MSHSHRLHHHLPQPGEILLNRPPTLQTQQVVRSLETNNHYNLKLSSFLLDLGLTLEFDKSSVSEISYLLMKFDIASLSNY